MMYSRWEYTSTSDSTVSVMPDGCLDVLITQGSMAEPDSQTHGSSLRLTHWDFRARLVSQYKGQKTIGFRLRPGVTLDSEQLGDVKPTTDNVEQWVVEIANNSVEVCEVIDELCIDNTSLQQVARKSGVSIRTLQRHFSARGLPPPDYWRRLARVRNAAAALTTTDAVVDIAGHPGFSDQSHLTREFVQWFSVTPNRVRRNPELLNELCQPGLGNWTTEQISIR